LELRNQLALESLETTIGSDLKNNFRANGNIAGISRTSTCEMKIIANDFACSLFVRDPDLHTDWHHEIEREYSSVKSLNHNILIQLETICLVDGRNDE
jgi:hypothetical protein